jgi:hypothetical protein
MFGDIDSERAGLMEFDSRHEHHGPTRSGIHTFFY